MTDLFPRDQYSSVIYSSSNRYVVGGTIDGTIRVVDLVNGVTFSPLEISPSARVGSPIFHILEFGSADSPYFAGFGLLGGVVVACPSLHPLFTSFKATVESVNLEVPDHAKAGFALLTRSLIADVGHAITNDATTNGPTTYLTGVAARTAAGAVVAGAGTNVQCVQIADPREIFAILTHLRATHLLESLGSFTISDDLRSSLASYTGATAGPSLLFQAADTPYPEQAAVAALAVSGDRIIVGTEVGSVVELQPDAEARVAALRGGRSINAVVVDAGSGLAYASSEDGIIYQISPADGENGLLTSFFMRMPSPVVNLKWTGKSGLVALLTDRLVKIDIAERSYRTISVNFPIGITPVLDFDVSRKGDVLVAANGGIKKYGSITSEN